MRQNQKYCFRKIGGGKLTLATHAERALLVALLLTGAFCVPAEAAVQSEPLVVTKTGQTVTDDFDVKDCGKQAVLEIGSTAAADKKGVTFVNSKTISGTYSNKGEANGIWVQDKYPGKVNLADGMTVEVDAAGNHYNATGIYLEGVDRSHDPKSTDESVNANEEYKNNGNQISSTTVNVGSGSTITVNDKAPEGNTGTFVNSVALENHFGHMNVGDNVHLNLTTGAFKENYSAGFYQLYYGNTSIGNGFTSTVTVNTGNDSGPAIVSAVKSLHDRPNDQQIHALTQNKLYIGDDASLTTKVSDQTQGDYTEKGSIDETGAFLSRTDFTIGDRMKVYTEQTGIPGRKGDGINESTHINGIYTRAAKGSIGSDLTNTVKVKNRNMQMVAGMRFSGWLQNGYERPENPSDDTSIVSVGARNMNKIDVEDSIARHLGGIIADSDSKINIGQECQIHMDIIKSQVSGYTYGIYAVPGSNANIDFGSYGAISLMQEDGTSNLTYGIYAGSNSKIDFGSHGTFSLTQVGSTSNETIGIRTDPNSKIDFGSYGTVSLKQDGGTVSKKMGIYAGSNANIDFGSYGAISLMQEDGTSNQTYGICAGSNTNIDFGPHGTISLMQEGGTSNLTMGIFAAANTNIDFGPHGTISLMQEGGTSNVTIGIYALSGSKIDFGPYGTISLQFAGDYQENSQENSQILSDLWNYGADTEVKDHASFTVSGNLTKAVPQAGTQIRGIYVGNGIGTFGDDLTVHTSGHNYAMVSGIVAVASADTEKTNLSVGDNAHVTVDATEDEMGTTNRLPGGNYIAGIKNSGRYSSVTVGRNAQINVSAPEDKDASALWVYENAEMKLGDGAVLTVNSAAAENNNVVKADSGKVTFDGGMTLSGSQNAIYSTGEGSSVIATGEGRKVILGNLESAKGGSIKLNLNTNDSLLRGKSTVDDFKSNGEATHGLIAAATAAEQTGSSRTELALANGALWDMTSSSQVTKLDHRNGGIVNMAYNKEYQTLKIGNFSGQDGTFRMKTDLDSQTDGDKVYMTSAEAGSKGLVQVHDESFLKGKEVTGTKHLLLITDDSKNATFSGLTLDEGGLWDVTPTIQNGQYVHDVMGVADANEKQWYLTKLEKKVNKDTIPLMKAADNSYALYRLDIDSLRKRMGDLRFRNVKDDSGIWARDFHGAYEGQGTDSRYNGFQLGYDYAANEKSLYGFFAERTISNPKYSYGSSKDHGLSGGLYGTWFGDSGVYTDVVAKWGRNDTELHTRGGWPDSANYRTRSESLSVEWGKTFTRDDGLFLEPEAQMVFGRLGSKDYTTSRGRTVHMGSYDSAIGRLGLLLGKRVTEGDHPYDYYLKFSLLHEFGGERNFHLAAPDGETMDHSEDYRDTWQEAGFGGTWHINGNTSIYADAERSFNGSWHKKWQWNLGINWQF